MVVRELVALLGVKPDQKGFNQAENGMEKLTGLAKKAIAAFSAFKLAQFFKNLILEVAELGDQFDKMSKRSGIAAGELQKLGFAAQLSGASISDMETGIKRLQAAQVEAIDGVATYKDEFKRMGVEVKNQDGTIKDTSQLLVEMADGMQNLETDAERTAVAMKLLGRGGAKLIPLLKQGSEAVADMMMEMEQLGGIIDDDLVQASADFVDNQLRVDMVLQGVKNTIAKQVLPFLNKSTEGFVEWWKINGQIIRQKVGNTIKGIGRVLKGVGTAIKGVVSLFTRWVKKLGPTEIAILKIGTAITILGSLIMKGPIGRLLALATVIGLIIDDFQTWQKGGKSVTGALIKWFNDVLDIDIVSWVKLGIDWFQRLGTVIISFFQNVIQTGLALVKLMALWWLDPQKAFEEFLNVLDLNWQEFWNTFKESFPEAAKIIEDFVAKSIKNLGEFFVWMGEIAGRIFDTIKLRAIETAEAIMKPFEAARKIMASLFGNADIEKIKLETGAEVLGEVQRGLKVVGGGERPQALASVRTAGSTLINQPNTTISVDIKGTPGMSPTALAEAAAKKVSQAMDNQNRRALKAFTPAAGG